jgi:hypothetical protein
MANEVICNNDSSCLLFKAGSLIATILKLTTTDNHIATSGTVELSGGTGTQNLTLYFDEIQNLSTTGGNGVNSSEGFLNLIGRRIYSTEGMSLNLVDDIVGAYFQCVEIISGTKGININNSDEQIIIDANYIEGSNGNDGVIKCNDSTNLVLRNAKIKNTYSGSSSPYSRGIYITDTEEATQLIQIENLIIVTGTTANDFSIYRDGSNNIDIKNLTLFVKKAISGHITLKIGTEAVTGNYKYIISSDIT